MKTIALFALLMPFFAAAQSSAEYFNPKQYGYVAGVRIDTIEAQYAQAEYPLGATIANNLIKRFVFRWNQANSKNDDKLYRLTDAAGEVLTFPTTSAALNFFHYNGWELKDIYPTGYLLHRYRTPK